MALPHVTERKERDETDASLTTERSKTDTELARGNTAVEIDADDVVSVARERADAVLHATRDQADRDMNASGAVASERSAVHEERELEDKTLRREQSAADERTRVERDDRRLALHALLHLERTATDERLLLERERADRVVRTRDDFLGMVSHDLRTMLGGVALGAELLARDAAAEGEPGADRLRHLERIQRFTARMNRLVGDLLDVLSLESGALRVSLAVRDVHHLLLDAADAFHSSFSAKGISLTVDVAADALLATFDNERILQVLANLLSNALKFTEAGGHVTLRAAAAGTDVQVSILDDGAGVPPHLATAIFERFHQVNASDHRGVGLGLYITKCIVEAHGGRLWLEHPATGGSRFNFTLPATHEAAKQAERT